MRYPNDSDKQDLNDLSRRINRLLDDGDEIDLTPYIPKGTQTDDTTVYRNYSNNYGRSSSGAPRPKSAGTPAKPNPNPNSNTRPKSAPAPAPQTQAQKAVRQAAQQPQPSPKRRSGCCGVMLAGLFLVALLLFCLIGSIFEMPVAPETIGERKSDTAAILLCGTDKDGTRTDTMMLLYLSGSENRVGLLSLPRDSMTKTAAGKYAKLNSAYGRNGCGEKGMDVVMDYVADIIGYHPDGYILVDMTLVPDIVDLMGGIDILVEQAITVDDVHLDEGFQHLNGKQTLALLRYRKGYSNADLGRVQVQRKVIQACMEQWITPAKLSLLPDALNLVTERSVTNLETPNFLWAAKTILGGMDNLYNDTLPGYAKYRNGASYYILKRDEVAAMVNDFYNPYTVTIDADDLTIVN